ncbi:MAG: metallophosphoesterase [Pleurocapsa sp. SU_5_0]|nr:metallophosphoesterase [Pleurocapsa sp. SU_5_0]NJO96666.1 metallophosphoesterase [Pleurocapsa sp. CRU_1_2]
MKRQFTRWFVVGVVSIFMLGYLTVEHNRAATSNLDSVQIAVKNLDLPPRQDFRLVVISDLNSQYGSTEYEPEVAQAIALIPQWHPDLVLCGGDMIAGQKASLTKSQIESMWAAFDLKIAAPLRRHQIPLGLTIGNHDGSGAIKDQTLIFQAERNLAQAYWQHQHQFLNFVDRANFPFYYSFQQNKIFFLVWDASTSQISPQQLEWIEQTLQTPAAQQATARIVLGHLPLYPVAKTKNKPGEYLEQGNKLRSLLTENHVLMYISGHHHAYYPGKVDNLEMLHAGALGQGARELINSQLSPRQTITIIDLDLAKSTFIYTTYDATTWQKIALEELPASIPTKNVTIWRHDLKIPDGKSIDTPKNSNNF